VQVQIKDMAFRRPPGCLQLGADRHGHRRHLRSPQERDAVVDFTNVYYVGEGAVLRGRSAIGQITSVDDVQHLRIGVQKSSVYETWLRDNRP